MELGILERIESKLDKLLGEGKDTEDHELKTSCFTGKTTESPAINTESSPTKPQEAPTGSGEFDDGGYEWDERIHSGSKNKTAKGVWKKLRGVDPELYNKIMAEQTINSSPDAPEIDKNAAPPPPTVPSASAPPTPSTPAVNPTDEIKKKAMTQIAKLTTEYGIDFEKVIAELPDGAASFDALDPSKYQEVATHMEAWNGWLNLCHEEHLKVIELGKDIGEQGMMSIYGHYNKSTHFNQISPADLNVVHDCLQDYRKKWEAVK